MCRLIHKRYDSTSPNPNSNLPYAFRLGTNTRFNRQNGELMLGDGLGLTCSTFVLSVFESVGVPMVVFDGWPIRPEDDQRHETLLEMMRNGIPQYQVPPADPQHVDRVAAQLPCIRIRPEEVAATAMFDQLPATFAQLEPAGRWVLSRLPLPS
jgi:hypothetical protein